MLCARPERERLKVRVKSGSARSLIYINYIVSVLYIAWASVLDSFGSGEAEADIFSVHQPEIGKFNPMKY